MDGIRRTDGHILRRNTRLSLDFNAIYDPVRATPEENTFEFMKGNGSKLGKIVFKEFHPNHAAADTPWGIMTLSKPSFMGQFEVRLRGSLVGSFSISMSRTKVSVTFARGERIQFSTKLITMGLSGEAASGKIDVLWEGEYGPGDVKQEGVLRRDMPGDVSDKADEARADYKARKKAKMLQPDEPKSMEMPHYIQWRILLPKEYEGREDVLSTLAFMTGYRCLRAEIPPSGLPG